MRGDDVNSVRLSAKPFQTASYEQVDLCTSESIKSKKKSDNIQTKDLGTQQKSPIVGGSTTKKWKKPAVKKLGKSQRDRLEALLREAKL